MAALAPINIHGNSHATVQSALLQVLFIHETLASAKWNDPTKYPSAAAELLEQLVVNLRAIRNGIAARAPADACELEVA